MFEVNRANSFRLRLRFALAFAQFERFILTDVKELSGKKFVQLLI